MVPPARPVPAWRRAAAGLSLLLSAGCLVLLGRAVAVSPAALLDAAGRMAPLPLGLALVVGLGVQLFAGPDRFRRALGCSGHRLPYRTALAMRLGAGPLRLLTPLKAGGLADLAFLHRELGTPPATTAGALAYDRLLNLVGLLAWLLLGLCLGGSVALPAGVPAVAGIALVALLWTVLSDRPGRWLPPLAGRLHPRLGRLARSALAPVAAARPAQRAGLLAYALAYQASPWLVGWLVLQAAGVAVGPAAAMVAVDGAMLLAQLPGPLAGVGPREASVVGLLAGSGPPAALLLGALWLSAIVSVGPLVLGLPWLPWYLRRVLGGGPAR